MLKRHFQFYINVKNFFRLSPPPKKNSEVSLIVHVQIVHYGCLTQTTSRLIRFSRKNLNS